ncbi:MAG: indolepyruvate oxidoreductase subunit beta [Candidatus Aminicenantes bacterium]|nr:indolepyruvate oxidoreductase subunit beta [Candidatus Aminicenantes bacterium]
MGKPVLFEDPYNLIISGVGGQGNVVASRILGGMMSLRGFCVTIGEAFGASQRGGSVMSHLRISSDPNWSPQIPKGKAHMIMGLEPVETIRVLVGFGNPGTKVLCNSRPIHPIGVIAGELSYPSAQNLRAALEKLARSVWILEATDAAIALGDAILGNMVMIGALAKLGELPLCRNDLKAVILEMLPPDEIDTNLEAFNQGLELARGKRYIY